MPPNSKRMGACCITRSLDIFTRMPAANPGSGNVHSSGLASAGSATTFKTLMLTIVAITAVPPAATGTTQVATTPDVSKPVVAFATASPRETARIGSTSFKRNARATSIAATAAPAARILGTDGLSSMAVLHSNVEARIIQLQMMRIHYTNNALRPIKG
jgi:hypothetical protein